MKQILRSLCTLLMLVVWASGSFAATTTIDFSSGLPKDWTKKAGTIANNTYQSKKCLQLQKNTTIESSVFTTKVIKKIELSLCKSNNSDFNISYQIGNNTPIVIATKVGSSMKKQKWSTFSFDFPEEAQVEGGKIIIENSISSYFIEKITLTEIDNSKKPSDLSFPNATESVDINGTFNAPVATLTSEGVTISGKNIKYTSSNKAVATVNESTGEVTIVGRGHTKITASLTGDAEYNDAEASYILTVIDPNVTDVTFDFSKPGDYKYEVPKSSSSPTYLEEGDKIQSGIITITNIQSGKNGTNTNRARFHNNSDEGITFRVYTNGIISLSAEAGYTITKFAFESTKGGYFTVSSGTYDSATKTWEGNAQSITLTIPNGKDATFFQTMTVTYSKVATTTPLTLDENADDTDTKIENNNGKTVDVTLTRTLTAGAWNTICLPFDVTAEQIASVLKSAGNVKEYGSEDVTTSTIKFNDATTMQAGVPYLIKPTESATVLEFKGVTIKNVEDVNRKFGSDYKICGTFGKYTMKTDGTELFLKTDGKFYIPAAGTATMKGFRAYFFNINGSTAGAALNLSFGEATGIDGVAADAEKNVKVYNVNGQYVGTSLEALPKGLYIVGGKKVLK